MSPRSTPPAKPDGYLPLSEQVFQILVALADEARHGYGIIQEIEQRTDGSVRLGTGTLYTAIKRLLGQGLIQETAKRPDPSIDDSRRRYYSLTARGRQVARAEAARLKALVGLARQKSLVS